MGGKKRGIAAGQATNVGHVKERQGTITALCSEKKKKKVVSLKGNQRFVTGT